MPYFYSNDPMEGEISSLFKDDVPDFSFTIVENSPSSPNFLHLMYSQNQIPRLKAHGGISTILEMNNLMSNSFDIIAPLEPSGTTNYFNKIGNDTSLYLPGGIWFSPDFPDFLIPVGLPGYQAAPQVVQKAITWGVVRQEPGGTDPFRGTRDVRPRVREYIALFGNETAQYIIGSSDSSIQNFGGLLKFITVKGQTFDNLVQYNIWSKSNYEVERLTEWFQYEYMDNFIGMFREAGIINLWFDRRIRDDTLTAMKNGYHVRSVLYYVRTERLSFNTVGPIKQINLNINVRDLATIVNNVKGHKIDSDLEKRLVNKWIKKYQFGG
jgi:hypothetical protein